MLSRTCNKHEATCIILVWVLLPREKMHGSMSVIDVKKTMEAMANVIKSRALKILAPLISITHMYA